MRRETEVAIDVGGGPLSGGNQEKLMSNQEQARYPEFSRIVDNRLFVGLARLMMIFMSIIVVPLIGFMLSRIVATSDKISDKVNETATKVIVLDNNVQNLTKTNEFALREIRDQLRDHEGRIRSLERTPPPVVIETPSVTTTPSNRR